MTAPPGYQATAVVGGGTAGYFAAIALKRFRPAMRVVVIESSSIPIIGVGEATTPLLVPFLFHQLGIDIHDFHKKVMPTWKLGIKFDWGLPGPDYFFNFPFGTMDLLEALTFSNDVRACSLTSLLMAAEKGLVLENADGSVASLMPQLKFAYHLDNKRFVHYLAGHARRIGVEHVDATITQTRTDPTGERVVELIASDGQRLSFDLYVDCSGFRSLLIGQALRSPFQSFATSLFCDSAVVASVPHGGVLKPYTLAESMACGWCWNIPQVEEDHRGYVFSSAFMTVEEAAREMRQKNPQMGDHWTVKFRSGRHADFWKGNVVAIGNAYGFVEPLESTALHMVIVEVARLLQSLDQPDGDRTFENRRIGEHWDYLRWFLALHYRFNQRFDNPFWRACRESVDASGLAEEIQRYRAMGMASYRDEFPHDARDAIFGRGSIELFLAGQGVPWGDTRPRVARDSWERRVASERAIVQQAVAQRRALEYLDERPELLSQFVEQPDSWYRTMVNTSAPVGGEPPLREWFT